MLAAVILAGGISKRFGANKLLYKVDGEAIISRVFKAASGLTANVYLSVKNREQAETLQGVCNEFSGVIFDSHEGVSGPINGIITSLKALKCEEVIIIPGDMPFLNSEALFKFIDECRGLDAVSGSIYWPNGWISILLQYHRRDEALRTLHLPVLRGAMSRSSDILRAAARACYIPASRLTKDSRTLVNINTPSDLSLIKAMDLPFTGRIKCIEKSTTYMFIQATNLIKKDTCLAAKYYLSEGMKYEEAELYTLALHAYKDAKMCCEKTNSYELDNIDKKINHLKLLLSLSQ